MTLFAYKDEVDRIDLGDGFWIDIKRELSAGDSEFISNEIIKLRLKPAAFTKVGKPTISDIEKTELKTGNIATLLRAITAWNLTDRSGKEVPVTRESISQLKTRVYDKLLEEVRARNPF